MVSSASRFNIVAMRGKRRLTLHRAIRDLQTAVRMACEFSALRPARLEGLFITETATGALWSLTDLVEGTARTEANGSPPVNEQPEPSQASG